MKVETTRNLVFVTDKIKIEMFCHFVGAKARSKLPQSFTCGRNENDDVRCE